MQIAVLIMMHKNPDQVLRLLRWYQTPETVCFIHVDKKLSVDLDEFRKQVKQIKPESVVLEERMSGVLFSWSLVEITLKLAEYAVHYEEENKVHFSYYQLISGQDYPIGKYEEWLELLKKSYPNPFLNVCSRASEERMPRLERVRLNRVRDGLEDGISNPGIRKCCILVLHLLERIVTCLTGKPIRRLNKAGIDPAYGTQWWTLPDDVMVEALAAYHENGTDKLNTVYRVVRNTGTSDEVFFQTVFLNGSFSDRKRLGNLTFCNFGGRGRENTGHPYVIEMEDMDTIRYWAERNHFFARKFDVNVDENVMDEIDRQIYP